MAAYNIDFVLAQSTGQAVAELRKQDFAAIISDMDRPPDSRAGYTLLGHLVHVFVRPAIHHRNLMGSRIASQATDEPASRIRWVLSKV